MGHAIWEENIQDKKKIIGISRFKLLCKGNNVRIT